MRKTIFITILLFIISIIFIGSNNVEAITGKNTSIYMWEVKGIDYETYDKMVDYLDINKIYAYIGTADIKNRIDEEVKLLFEFAKRKNIEIYAVYDENYENQLENANRIKEFINEIQEYNKTSICKIKGIAIDSEFHTLDGYNLLSKEEQIELFREYVGAMKTSYESARQANLDYVVCIPVWLNKLEDTLLEELIKEGCSYVQLMNYSKTNMISNINEEVVFAKKYNKKIENIAEFQIPGPHEVTENDTFYNDGLEAGINSFKEIDENYNYDLLTYSFHYYKPVLELYKKLNINNNEQQEINQKIDNEINNEINNEIEKKENLGKNNTESNLNDSVDNTKAKGIIPKTGEENNKIILTILIVSIVICVIELIKIYLKK